MKKQALKEISLKFTKTEFERKKITTSKDAADIIKKFYSCDINIYESFFILLLNRSSTTIGFSKISQGGVAGTVVDLKIIAKYAIDSLASGIILAHNHPSGNLRPSDTDLQLTKKVKEGLKLLDVSVMDHLILTEESYYSFADEGVL
jgi:DNA repair protein RadC